MIVSTSSNSEDTCRCRNIPLPPSGTTSSINSSLSSPLIPNTPSRIP